MIPLGVYVVLLVFSAVIIIAGMYIVFKSDSSGKKEEDRELIDENEQGNEGNGRRGALRRRQGRFNQEEEGNEMNLDQEAEAIRENHSGKIGTKKAMKLAAKAQAKREREALQAMREQKKQQDERDYEERKQREAEEAEIERQIVSYIIFPIQNNIQSENIKTIFLLL